MTAGLVAVLAALAVATGVGLAWRRGNGRMRAPRRPPALAASGGPVIPTETGPATWAGGGDQGGAPASAAGSAPAVPVAGGTGARVTAALLGQPLGERATLLEFSSAFCAPCRATRRVLADVAGMTPGVAHIDVDAEQRLDLVRSLGVMRTPTVLVLGPDGAIVRRASGQPRKADVIGALGLAIGTENPYSTGLETG
jgi:thiol-disulfide isomerase/thioredoxin